MATIKTPAAGVSPYPAAAAAPTVLRASADGTTVLANAAAATATVSDLAAANANTLVVVTGQAALNSLISTSQPGVFDGANVTINLEEQNFTTTNQVTATTNYPSGNTGEIQFNSGSNSFASNAFFTYTNSNVVTSGIRTDGYFYSNGSPFTGGGNAAIGNFVFTGDAMTIAHANSTLSVTGNGTGNVNVTANSKTWIFGASGNLTLPANTFAVNYANGNPVVISVAGANLPLANGTSNINIATANGNVTITANVGNTWTFDTGGNLVFPSNLIIDNESPNTRIYMTSGSLKIRAQTTASLKLGWDEFTGANANGSLAHVIANGGAAGQPANLVVLTGNTSSTTYQWIFDNQGDLSAPGNISAVNLVINSIRSDDSSFVTVEDGVNITSGLISAPESMLLTAGANTWNFDNTGTLTVPGDIVSANLIGTGSVSASGNVFGNNINANYNLSAFGNVYANSAILTFLASTANLQVSGTANVGSLSTVGSVSANGNITSLSAIYSGNGATWQTQVALANVLFVGADVGDEYIQAAMVETGGNGSADWVSYSNNGNTDAGWIDMGITGNTFNDPNYELTDPNDGYILVQGTNVSGTPLGGNLILATGTTGFAHDIVFATGGFTHANIKARLIDTTGEFSVVGNIAANNLSGTNLVINSITSDDSTFVTVEDGVNVNGEISATGDITGSAVKTGSFVAGTIPAAGVGAGARVFVTDADSVTFGNLYVGGAANAMPVWSNGTNWYIG